MIRWITGELGTAPWGDPEAAQARALDIRDLVDKAGNLPAAVRSKIDTALAWLEDGERVVVCCDYGISRSNAVAAGILALREGIDVDEALGRVIAATGEKRMRVEVVGAVRRALGDGPGPASELGAVLVTGGSGFVGAGLAAVLGDERRLVAPSRSEVDLTTGAVELELQVRKHRVDAIVHLANPRVYVTNEAMGTTLTMLKNVLDVCVATGAFLVFPSSWEVFGGYATRLLRADESLPINPGTTYGHTKQLCELLFAEYRRRHGLAGALLRPSPSYGPGSDKPRFLFNFLDKARRGDPIVTHEYENGPPALDLLHVDDLRRAIAAVLARRAEGTFHLGTGVATSTAEIAARIVRLVGSSSPVTQQRVEGHASNIAMDAGRAAREIGWRAAVPLDRGLADLVA